MKKMKHSISFNLGFILFEIPKSVKLKPPNAPHPRNSFWTRLSISLKFKLDKVISKNYEHWHNVCGTRDWLLFTALKIPAADALR
jgi:hypothetical protein